MGLLNQARVKTEKIIDILYEARKGKLEKKPKTYRNLARRNYLQVAKKRRPSRKQIRKAIRKQLQYVKRNLSHIEQLIQEGGSLEVLNFSQYKSLLVVAEVYRQQQWMYNNKTSRIEDRIVSLSQPHIRPIVRGKAGTPVEFGVSKRRFSLNRVMRQLPHTSQTAIAITFLVRNLSTLLRQVFAFFCFQLSSHLYSGSIINSSYDWRNSQQLELIIL